MNKQTFIIQEEKNFNPNILPSALKKSSILFYSDIDDALNEVTKQKPDALIIFADSVSTTVANELIRRNHLIMLSKNIPPIYILLCGIILYPKSQEIYKDGEEIHFSPIERQLIWMLLENRNEIVFYSDFYSEVWGEGDTINARDFIDYKSRLAVHISSIRKKLKFDNSIAEIICINEKGYKFKEKFKEKANS